MLQVTIPLALAAAYVASGTRRLGAADKPRRFSTLFAFMVVAAHAAWLGFTLLGDNSRLSITEVVSLCAFSMALVAALSTPIPKSYAFTGVLFVLAGITTATTAFDLSDSSVTTTPGWPLLAHISFSLIANTLFAIAAIVALTMTWKERQIRRSQVSAFAEKLPSLLKLEHVLFMAITVGFVTLSLAVFSGLIFIENIRAQHLTHKTVLTLLSWIVFGALLIGRWRFGWRGRKAVRWTLIGFALLLLAYFGSRLVLEVILNQQWG